MAKGFEAISPLSGASSTYLFSATVLGRHTADFFMDPLTDYIFIDQPHWLEEAYSEEKAISATDTGILARNLRNVSVVADLMEKFFPDQQGIDLGGGYGIFVRGMRDQGFNFFWSDLYAKNLMARGFEGVPGNYPLAVAFEVLEHTKNPLAFIEEQRIRFQFNSFCFSATCFDPENLPPTDWWYWSLESGQHISFFSRRTLEWLAEKISLNLFQIEDDIYMMAPESFGHLKRMRSNQSPIKCREPLTFVDHLSIAQRIKAGSLDG